jgi:hypothetical protein
VQIVKQLYQTLNSCKDQVSIQVELPPEAKHGAEEAMCNLISDDEEQPKKAQNKKGSKPGKTKKDKGANPEKTKKEKDATPKTKKDKDAKPEKKNHAEPKDSQKDKDAEPKDSQKDKELKEMEDPETPLKLGADCPSDGAEDGGLLKRQRTRTPQKKIAEPKVKEILQLHLDDHSTFSIGSYVLARC